MRDDNGEDAQALLEQEQDEEMARQYVIYVRESGNDENVLPHQKRAGYAARVMEAADMLRKELREEFLGD